MPINKYAKGAHKKIDENVANIIHIPTVNENCCNTALFHKKNIAANTINVDTDVPIDLLTDCHTLSSNNFP